MGLAGRGRGSLADQGRQWSYMEPVPPLSVGLRKGSLTFTRSPSMELMADARLSLWSAGLGEAAGAPDAALASAAASDAASMLCPGMGRGWLAAGAWPGASEVTPAA